MAGALAQARCLDVPADRVGVKNPPSPRPGLHRPPGAGHADPAPAQNACHMWPHRVRSTAAGRSCCPVA